MGSISGNAGENLFINGKLDASKLRGSVDIIRTTFLARRHRWAQLYFPGSREIAMVVDCPRRVACRRNMRISALPISGCKRRGRQGQPWILSPSREFRTDETTNFDVRIRRHMRPQQGFFACPSGVFLSFWMSFSSFGRPRDTLGGIENVFRTPRDISWDTDSRPCQT